MLSKWTTIALSLFLASNSIAAKHGVTSAQVLEQSPASDWRALDPENTLLMDLAAGQVIIELAPRFAPRHVANIRKMAHEGYFDQLAIVRVQDNYVTQWGDPNGETTPKSLGSAAAKIPAEFDVPLKNLALTRLKEADAFAPTIGWVDGMPVAANHSRAWLTHCYGMIGAGRDMAADSSNGSELYTVIGQSPRGLDLNITLVGRVLQGMQWLSALPRGTGAMGFYEKPEQRTTINKVRLLSDVPEAERPQLEMLRTDSKSWQKLLQARRIRAEEWFINSPGHVDLCSANVPIRAIKYAPSEPKHESHPS